VTPLHGKMRIANVAMALFSLGLSGCNGCKVTTSWRTWRADQFRSGTQLFETVLNDTRAVSTLHVVWTFTGNGSRGFRASPVVYNNGNVYIGDSDGYFYCLDGQDGHKIWQYPVAGPSPLTQKYNTSNPSGWGIASSAAITVIGDVTAVIFAAPDQSSGNHLGDGHIFALNANSGALLWESPTVARLNGLTSLSTSELHEQIGYSAPLIFNNHVYVGIADHGDDPIQQGRVVAVRLTDGSIDPNFNFAATPTRGGGVWGSLAAWDDVFVTTGNTRSWCQGCDTEPHPNYGLSLLRLNKDTGSVVWNHQPVPFSLDDDPDWAAGPAVMYAADCGPALVSTQKDGWTWAVHAGSGNQAAPGVMWAFPPGPWANGGFHPGDGTVHGDYDHKRPGATWGDVYIGVMGGWQGISDPNAGYTQLHALNVCATDAQRVRWIKDIPGSSPQGGTYPLGPPTVAVDGMIFVATNQGHIVAVADPTLQPAIGYRCEDPGIPNQQCQAHGRRLVPDPWFHDISLPGSPNDGIFGEPAIANGRIYVATISGHVYMLQP